MALVLVLGVLVLFTGLALAIFLTATTERRTSSLFAGSVEARQLADTGINLCMAQIRDATSATNRAWVSQPGLIRTFTGNRQPDTNYRLYSWTDMRPAGAFDPFSSINKVPDGWKTKKAAFVDINEPAPDPAAPADTTRGQIPGFLPSIDHRERIRSRGRILRPHDQRQQHNRRGSDAREVALRSEGWHC